ncbi:Oxysterol-binding protein [Hyaloscypha variabilis F]|uniref:Oxysterol-binding protein n=1 Tax=Hyaloscypha variabilis (strain UAMH 11265 / GT02V1 / F) TaxID=1149755 RepID=A0A2J6QVH5_HYAVF|nr:Oxysterol-binding protein [Hyaloscypha variabilis F]
MSTGKADRSSLREFLASIATIKGDLSNITAPPFVLATQSTVEFPSYWASHPEYFLAPASEPDPAKRALLVLRWFLTSLKKQQYGGRSENEGVKKPLNAFLGELFLATGEDGTRLIAEQVSHHPPVTACYLWNDQAGIRAEGFACQEISFNGSVNVKQTGHAILHLDKWKEDYLVPLPDVKIRGILTGTTYPELNGDYHIMSSTRFVADIDFSGKKWIGGKKNSVHAAVFKQRDEKHPLFTISGQWNEELTVREGGDDGSVIEIINVSTLKSAPMKAEHLEQQDEWESRKAWAGVIAALHAGDMQRTVDEKSKVEKAQREMRKQEQAKAISWEPLFFTKLQTTRDPILEDLAAEPVKEGLFSPESGMWKFNHERLKEGVERPFHGSLKPNVGAI